MEGLSMNNLMLSLLSQGGANLAGEDSLAASINPLLQGTIAAQNKTKEQSRQMALLSKLLGTGVDFKSDATGKATVSGDLATLLGEELAKSSGLGGIDQPVGQANAGVSDNSGPVNTNVPAKNIGGVGGLLSKMLNFNSSPSDVPSYSDLVGLTPKDISDSLAGAISVEGLKEKIATDAANLKLQRDQLKLTNSIQERQLGLRSRGLDIEESKIKSIESNNNLDRELKQAELDYKIGKLSNEQLNDEVDRLYKRALTQQAEAATEKNKPSITIPGTDIKLTSGQYVDWYKAASKDERTAAIKNYEYAVAKGYEGSFEQFQDTSKTTHQKDYEAAKKGGYEGSFNDWMLEMAKAGAINLGDIVARKEATEDIESVKYFTDPKGLVNDVDKYVNSEEVQNKLFALDEGKRPIETIRAKERYITNKITAAGGSIIKGELEGRTFVWTVKWPNGKTSKVKYAN